VDGGRQPALTATSVAPGECARGWLTFDVPAGQTPRYLVFSSSSTIYWALT
jgi:hypothetical protein